MNFLQVVITLLLSMIFLVNHAADALSMHTRCSQADSRGLSHHQNSATCHSVTHNEDEDVYVDARRVLTNNFIRRIISAVERQIFGRLQLDSD